MKIHSVAYKAAAVVATFVVATAAQPTLAATQGAKDADANAGPYDPASLGVGVAHPSRAIELLLELPAAASAAPGDPRSAQRAASQAAVAAPPQSVRPSEAASAAALSAALQGESGQGLGGTASQRHSAAEITANTETRLAVMGATRDGRSDEFNQISGQSQLGGVLRYVRDNRIAVIGTSAAGLALVWLVSRAIARTRSKKLVDRAPTVTATRRHRTQRRQRNQRSQQTHRPDR